MCQLGSAQQVSKVNSDQWSMTDALGRKAVEQEEIAGKKGDKVVAMFYWTWHQGNDDTTYQVKNITEIVRKNPEAMKDYNHPGWGTKSLVSFSGRSPCLDIIKRPIPGCYDDTLKCLPMQG